MLSNLPAPKGSYSKKEASANTALKLRGDVEREKKVRRPARSANPQSAYPAQAHRGMLCTVGCASITVHAWSSLRRVSS